MRFFLFFIISLSIHLFFIRQTIFNNNHVKHFLKLNFTKQMKMGFSHPFSSSARFKKPGYQKKKHEKSNANEGGLNESQIISAINSKIQNSLSYPALARRMQWQGKVQIQVTCTEANKVTPVIIKSSGYEILDKVAYDGVKKWLLDCTAQEHFILKFSFRLN